MGIEWVRIYDSKPEVKNGSGKEKDLLYTEVSGRVILADGGGVVAAGEAFEKEESVKASVSVA